MILRHRWRPPEADGHWRPLHRRKVFSFWHYDDCYGDENGDNHGDYYGDNYDHDDEYDDHHGNDHDDHHGNDLDDDDDDDEMLSRRWPVWKAGCAESHEINKWITIAMMMMMMTTMKTMSWGYSQWQSFDIESQKQEVLPQVDTWTTLPP